MIKQLLQMLQPTKNRFTEIGRIISEENMMYYWLDFTTSIQMYYKQNKEYVAKNIKEVAKKMINHLG